MDPTDGESVPVPDDRPFLVAENSTMSHSSKSQSVVWLSEPTLTCRLIWSLNFILLKGKFNRSMICMIQVAKAGDCEQDHILLNDVVRKKLEVNVGDKVFYEYPVIVELGKEIFVSRKDQEIDPEDLLYDYIGPFFQQNRFVVIHENDIFTAPNINGGRSAEFKIIETVPSRFCKVGPGSKFIVKYAKEINTSVKASNYHVSGCSTPKKMKVTTEQHDKMYMTDLRLAESNPLSVSSPTISPPPPSLPSPPQTPKSVTPTIPKPKQIHTPEHLPISDLNIAGSSNHVSEKINIVKIELGEEEPLESEPTQVSSVSEPAPEDQESSQSGPPGFGAECLSENWPAEDQKRISKLISKLIPLPLSKMFHKNCEAYAGKETYPVDLHLIKSRLDGHYYRQLAAIMTDIESIPTSAAKMFGQGTYPYHISNMISDFLKRIVGEQPKLQDLTYEISSQYEPKKSESNTKTGTMNTAPSFSSTRRSSSFNMRVPPIARNEHYRTRSVANAYRNN